MNKKLIPIVVQLKQNNNHIAKGIEQNDMGVLFDITIMDGLKPFDFSGYSIVTLKIVKPDGTFRYDSGDSDNVDIIDPTKGRLKINIPTTCTAQNGMHFCTIGFGLDEDTFFQTMSFNYFVGEDPNASNESVESTDEYPILANLVATLSEAVTNEENRKQAEGEREDAEEQRAEDTAALLLTVNEALANLEDAMANAESLLTDINEALAHGGSVDVSQLSALASKTWVSDHIGIAVRNLDFRSSVDEMFHTVKLRIRKETNPNVLASLSECELCLCNGHLYMGTGNNNYVDVNSPCFIVGTTAPTDTTRLWIDTSGSSAVIKYYDGDSWESCNTAVFG